MRRLHQFATVVISKEQRPLAATEKSPYSQGQSQMFYFNPRNQTISVQLVEFRHFEGAAVFGCD